MDPIGNPQEKRLNSERKELSLWLGLFETNWAGSFFPLAALLEQLNTLETLKDAAFSSYAAGLFETCVL